MDHTETQMARTLTIHGGETCRIEGKWGRRLIKSGLAERVRLEIAVDLRSGTADNHGKNENDGHAHQLSPGEIPSRARAVSWSKR